MALPLILTALLFTAGCSGSSLPDRQPTKADVDAGTACYQAPISVIVWKETDRKYVGEGIWCKYEK
jgi:hypothetical protein